MSIEREAFAIAYFLGKIFVMGGCSENQSLDLVESYDPLLNRWSAVAFMKQIRYGAKACVIGGDLYVVGGSNMSVSLNNIERYDHRADIWTLVNMKEYERNDSFR